MMKRAAFITCGPVPTTLMQAGLFHLTALMLQEESIYMPM